MCDPKSQPIYCKQHTTPTHGYMKPQNNTTASHWKGEKLRLQFTLRVGLIREIRELLNDNIIEYKNKSCVNVILQTTTSTMFLLV